MNKITKQSLLFGITWATIIVATSLIIKFLFSREIIGGEMSSRLIQVVIGFGLVAAANRIPKLLSPLKESSNLSSTEQSLKRVAGWILVGAGLAYSTIWLFVPMQLAGWISMTIVAASVIFVLALQKVSCTKDKDIEHAPVA